MNPAPAERVLVTGAHGFVGAAVCGALAQQGYAVRGAVRAAGSGAGVDTVTVGDIGAGTDWSAALRDIDVVVHLAARAHVMGESGAGVSAPALAAYRKTNVEGTRGLARAAAAARVRLFIYLSSVKVHGEGTDGKAFDESDTPQPQDAYGVSKWEAELALSRIAGETGLAVTVLRAPLVYGPGVKGNFLSLLRAVARGVPLPLASVANRRSLVYLGNLADAVAYVIARAQAAGETYLVADDGDVATPQLVRELAAALGVPARLLPCPPFMLRGLAALVGRAAAAARLAGSLQIDSARIRALGWRPPYTRAQGLAETARWYHARTAANSPPI